MQIRVAIQQINEPLNHQYSLVASHQLQMVDDEKKKTIIKNVLGAWNCQLFGMFKSFVLFSIDSRNGHFAAQIKPNGIDVIYYLSVDFKFKSELSIVGAFCGFLPFGHTDQPMVFLQILSFSQNRLHFLRIIGLQSYQIRKSINKSPRQIKSDL